VSNDNIVVGRVEDRACEWKVEMNTEREMFSWERNKLSIPQNASEEEMKAFYYQKTPIEPDLLVLNGVYDSYQAIKEAIIELRLKNAVELCEKKGKGSLKSYRKIGVEECREWDTNKKIMKTAWETVCGECGYIQTGVNPMELCQNVSWNGPKLCKARCLIPPTILDGVRVSNGSIYHSGGGSFSICTELGRVVPETKGTKSPESPLSSHSSVEELKEAVYSSG